MVPWKKNYGAMKKTMVLYQKRWFIINGKSYHHGKIEFFEQIYCLRTLLYYGKNYGSMGKNYDTMEKTMVLHRKLWNLIFKR